MRLDAKGVLFFLLLCLAAICPGLAQEKRASSNGADRMSGATLDLHHPPMAFRSLTPSEGLAILGAALDARHSHADFSSDCSHFIHGLYESAGFPYQYASSSDLYEGAQEFRRVTSPQPGDLAVWRGHAGIVVNPDQHSFFSVLHSGPGVDSYDSPYWKQRGHPRFFRYLKPAQGDVVHSSIRTASWQPKVSDDAEPDESTPDEQVAGISGKHSSQTASSSRLAENSPVNSETFRAVVLSSARPKSDQVSAAFLQACNDSETMLRGHDLFKLAQSLVVFDQFEVKKVHISGNQGWVEIQIDELVSLTQGRAEVHQQSERQQWALRRDGKKSWKLTPLRNAIYLPRHPAERLLAHELAQLTEDTSDNSSGIVERAELAQLLDVLFGK